MNSDTHAHARVLTHTLCINLQEKAASNSPTTSARAGTLQTCPMQETLEACKKDFTKMPCREYTATPYHTVTLLLTRAKITSNIQNLAGGPNGYLLRRHAEWQIDIVDLETRLKLLSSSISSKSSCLVGTQPAEFCSQHDRGKEECEDCDERDGLALRSKNRSCKDAHPYTSPNLSCLASPVSHRAWLRWSGA